MHTDRALDAHPIRGTGAKEYDEQQKCIDMAVMRMSDTVCYVMPYQAGSC